jgi:hypothetical protein
MRTVCFQDRASLVTETLSEARLLEFATAPDELDGIGAIAFEVCALAADGFDLIAFSTSPPTLITSLTRSLSGHRDPPSGSGRGQHEEDGRVRPGDSCGDGQAVSEWQAGGRLCLMLMAVVAAVVVAAVVVVVGLTR